MSEAVAHLNAKLSRAKEHIKQLDRELEAFLNEAPVRTIVNYDPQSAEAFKEFHRTRRVPARLSVLTGDVLYQLRSSLDHLSCALIVKDGGTTSLASQFPIFNFKPTKKDEIGRYQRQIEGITRPAILTFIESSQPYHRSDGHGRHWLSILKSLSNADKHHSLVLHVTRVTPEIDVESVDLGTGDVFSSSSHDDGTEAPIVGSVLSHPTGELIKIVNVERRLRTTIAFAQWGSTGRDVGVIDGLNAFLGGVKRTVYILGKYL